LYHPFPIIVNTGGDFFPDLGTINLEIRNRQSAIRLGEGRPSKNEI
jgi:hypothetical protein